MPCARPLDADSGRSAACGPFSWALARRDTANYVPERRWHNGKMPGFSLLQHARDFPEGAVACDILDESSGCRILVAKGFMGFCCYLGLPSSHLLAGVEDLEIQSPYRVNFRRWGQDGTPWPRGWYWWGWHYQNLTDAWDVESVIEGFNPANQAQMRRALMGFVSQNAIAPKDWTVNEIVQQAQVAAGLIKEQLQSAKLLSGQALAAMRGPAK